MKNKIKFIAFIALGSFCSYASSDYTLKNDFSEVIKNTQKDNIIIKSDINNNTKEESKSPAKVEKNNILFSLGKDSLNSNDINIIKKYILNSSNINKIYIIGNTDNIGSAASNQLLSKKRAYNVAKVIYDLGIPKSIIEISAVGESNPIATNKTSEGRKQNRRVEIIIK